MNYSVASAQYPVHVSSDPLRTGWLPTGATSGFIATFATTAALTGAFVIGRALGNAEGNALQHWASVLSMEEHSQGAGNRLTMSLVLTVALLIPWAVIYAYGFASRLGGYGWMRGAVFSIIPWSFSIGTIFPLIGLESLGGNLAAVAPAIVDSLFLHLVFGVTLGSIYGLDRVNARKASTIDREANANAERAGAVGIVIGGIAGLAAGWLIGPSLEGLASPTMVAFGFGLAGAAIGTMVGSLLGIRVAEDRS